MGSSSDSDVAIAFIVIGTIVTTALVFALFYYMLRIFVKGPTRGSDCKRRLDGKTVAITGGNSGIGRATALDLARRGARVLLLCRNTEKGEIAAKSIRDQISSEVSLQNHARSQSGIKKFRTLDDGGESGTIYKPDLQVYRLDLASTRCIRECAKSIIKNESGIDILINNAGVMKPPKNAKTEDGFDMQFGVNHLGHFLLTELLMPLLKSAVKVNKTARIVIVSSRSHHKGQIFWKDVNFYKNSYGDGSKAYFQSKLANVMHAKELARRLSGTGVNVYSLHPGTVDTKLLRLGYQSTWWGWWVFGLRLHRPFVKDTYHGAQTSLFCALDDGLVNESSSGRYYANCREARPSGRAMVVKDCKKLWDLSEHYLGLKSSSQSEML